MHGNTTHGDTVDYSSTPEYNSWLHIKSFCYDPTDRRFKYYGDKGIKVCERWLDDFGNFLSDMGRKPTNRHRLGRIDVNGDFEPSNCRWETTARQSRKRSYVKLTLVKVREIRMLWNMGYSVNQLSIEFDVSRREIKRVLDKVTWKEDERE